MLACVAGLGDTRGGPLRVSRLQMITDDFDIGKLLDQVLMESGFAESRASKMDVDDFLKCVRSLLRLCAFPADPSFAHCGRLLTCFHKHGMHFA